MAFAVSRLDSNGFLNSLCLVEMKIKSFSSLTLLIALTLSLGLFKLNAQTVVPGGNVFGTWTLAGSPYLIQGSIQIPNDSTLIVEAGDSIVFQGAFKLLVSGRLLAIGNTLDSITFTAADTSIGWRGVRFESTAANNDTSKLFYCKIQYGKAGSSGNDANGGGIFISDFSKIHISNCLIYKNSTTTTTSLGGGIYCSNASPIISGNNISNNKCMGNSGSIGGGGIYCTSSSPIISNNVIKSNNAFQGGGIFCNSSSAPLISGNNITNNIGGGIRCNSSPSTITGNTISNNTSGSGIDFFASSGNISSNLISNNNYSTGGGIYCHGGASPNIQGNHIIQNTSTSGGGIYCLATNANPNIINNIVSNNIASQLGGGIYSGSNPQIINNQITNNNATAGGGGIYIQTGNPTLINNTLCNNNSSKGGGIYCALSSDPTVRNSIFWGNTATTSGAQIFLNDESSDPNFYYCNIQSGPSAFGLNGNFYTGSYSNNIDSNPQFTSPSNGSGTAFNGATADWSLQSNSSCINSGDPNSSYISTDLLGNPRVMECVIDIGAYEYQAGTSPYASVSISALPSGPICFGASVTFTATTVNGGANPAYQWQYNGVAIAGQTGSTYTTTGLTDGSIITCILTSSNVCALGNPATSNAITMTVNTSAVVGVTVTASPGGSICPGNSVIFTASPSNGGTTPTYIWKKNVSVVGSNSQIYTDAGLINGDIITCFLTSSLTCATGSPASSNMITMVVNPSLPVGINIASAPSGTFCSGANVTYTATPTNGGSNPVFTWKKNGNLVGSNSATYTDSGLMNGDTITCSMGSSAACPTGNPATSNVLVATVNQSLPVSLNISASPAGSICAGTGVTFTAAPTNAGTSPTYLWRKNGNIVGTNSNTFSDNALTTGDVINCQLTSSNSCATGNPATSNSDTMAVNSDLPVAVSIAALPSGTICLGTSVTFTGSPTNGGANPVYLWRKNGNPVGTSSATYTDAGLTNADAITCEMTSSITCVSGSPAISNTVTMSVNAIVPVSVNIVAQPSGTVCPGTSITFSATTTNAGSTPTYVWKKNGTIVGTNNAMFTEVGLVNGDLITCMVLSTNTCTSGNPATSNTITVSLSTNLQVGVSIVAAPSGAICHGTDVIFTASPSNEGINPIYTWEKNGAVVGTNSSTYLDNTLIAGDVVSCELVSSNTCAIGNPAQSNSITMSVSSVLQGSLNLVALPTGAICQGTSVTFTANPSNGGATPAYLWKKNGLVVGGNNGTYTDANLANGDTIICELTSSISCAIGNPATSNTIVMSVNQNVPTSVSVLASPSGAVCSGASVTFTASPVNGGNFPSYYWEKNGILIGNNNSVYTDTTLINGDIIACGMTSSNSCTTGNPASSVPITSIVNQGVLVDISIGASPAGAICVGTPITFTGSGVNGGTSPIYIWKKNEIPVGVNNAVLIDAGLQSGDVITCTFISSLDCTVNSPANSNAVTAIVHPLPDATVTPSGPIPICSGDSVELNASTNYPLYSWSPAGSGQSIYVKYIGNYSVTVTSQFNCTASSTPVFINVNQLPTSPIITRSANTLTSSLAATYQWYLNGILLNGETNQELSLSQNGQYEVEITDENGCKNKSANFDVISVGVGDMEVPTDMLIYPNPTKSKFVIRYELLAGEKLTFEVFDELGQKKIISAKSEGKETILDTEKLLAGLYWLRINLVGMPIIKKFIKID